MSELAALKSAARAAAFARRKAAFERLGPQAAAGPLSDLLAAHRGQPLAGYAAMRTEIDPIAALSEAAEHGPVGLPVVGGPGLPLRFRAWRPGCRMMPSGFGTAIPSEGDWVVPQVLVVPLVAFNRQGGRLGYGGGFYDRTLAGLRAQAPVLAVGFAFAAQEDADLPLEATDQRLDLIVTEAGMIEPTGA